MTLFGFKPIAANAKLNRKLVTFLICFFLSLFFWFIITFSKEYTSTLIFPLSYTNLPKTKVVVNRLPESIAIDINASGFTILYYKLIFHSPAVKVDLKELKAYRDGFSYLAVNSKLDKLNRQFGRSLKIMKVSPDTIFANLSKRLSKTVPVKLNGILGFNKDYQMKDSIQLRPSRVVISGPEEQINKIRYAETVPVNLTDIDNTVSRNVKLLLANDTTPIEVSSPQIELYVDVLKVTEETMDVPVQIDNLPKGYSLKIFPDKVSLKFTAPFEEFKKMDVNSFRVRVDFLKKNGTRKLKVELVKKPLSVNSVKISPDKLEYIIRK